MSHLIWPGAIIAVIGVAGIVTAALKVMTARKAARDEAAQRTLLHKAMIWNMAAFFVAMIGLMMVVIGVILG